MEAADNVVAAGMAIIPYASFGAAASAMGKTTGTTVRTSGNPEDNNDAPAPFKGGTDANPTSMLVSASNGLGCFCDGGIRPDILRTKTGRKDR